MTQFLVDRIYRLLTLDIHHPVNLVLDSFLGYCKFRQVGREAGNCNLVGQIVLNSVRQYKVTVSQTLHQCGSTEAVCTVVREVTFTDSEQTLDRSHQFVVNPDTTHCIVDSRIDHHRIIIFHTGNFFCQFTWINVSDFLVHIEEVTIALKNDIDT